MLRFSISCGLRARRQFFSCLTLSILICIAVFACTAQAAGERRVALVIGNSAYTDAPLRNPVNDARAMASSLREVGFEVTLVENADRAAMQRASLEFGRKIKDDVAGLFYFAGHGMQVRGVNYLIPINAQVGSEEEVEVEAVDVNYILARMASAKNQFNIVILDACRNNPFERAFRSRDSGLAAISAPRGTLIAYATAPGSVAADGEGTNGLYTGQLITALKTPNLSLEQTFKRARAEVVSRSGGRQVPWESSSVIGDFFFRSQDIKAPTGAGANTYAADTALWDAVKGSREISDYRAYLDSYPQGVYAKLAAARIQALVVASAAVSASTSAPPTPNSKAPTESASIQRDDRSKTSDQDVIPLASALASTQSEVSASKAEEPLTHSAPQASVDYRTAMAYVKTHWPEIQDAVRAHFDNEANYAYYAHLTQARTIGENKLHKVSFYEVLSRIDNSVELVVLLQGSTPGSGFGFVHLSFNRYLRYRLLRQGDRFIVVEFRQATHSDMVTSLQ